MDTSALPALVLVLEAAMKLTVMLVAAFSKLKPSVRNVALFSRATASPPLTTIVASPADRDPEAKEPSAPGASTPLPCATFQACIEGLLRVCGGRCKGQQAEPNSRNVFHPGLSSIRAKFA